MNAQTIAAWAAENGFYSLDSRRYRRRDDARTITIEIKRMSVVLIDEGQGLHPRIISRLFKDMRFEGANVNFHRLLTGG